MNGLWKALKVRLEPDRSLPLEELFFQGLCLLGGLVALFVVMPMNTLQNLSPWVDRVVFVFGLVSLGLAWEARQGRYHRKTMLLAIIACLDLIWFPNGGSTGSVGLYFFTATLFLVLFFKGAFRFTVLVLLMANIIGLHLAEHAWPQLVHPFHGPVQRLVDLSTGYVICLLTCALMLWVILTEFNREQNRLGESEQKFRTYIEQSIDVIFTLDAAGTFLFVSPAWERQFGYPVRAVLGKPFTTFVHPEDCQLCFDLLAQVLASGGGVTSLPYRVRHANGSWRWFRANGSRLITPDGELRFMGVAHDITEQNLAEGALKASEERYRVQFDRAIEGIFTLSLEGALLDVNESMARMHGYTVEEMKRLNLKDLDTPESARLAPARMQRLLAGEALTFEVEHYHKDGHVFPLEVSASLISTEGESVILTFHREISGRKLADQANRLLEQEKQQAQKMDSLGSLAGGVAHDFNNMLGGIMGYADLLLAGELDPTRQKYLRAILAAASRSAELTQKLLAFGRRGKNRVESLDLQAMVKECLEMLQPSMSPDLRVEVALDSCPRVDGDPSQIHQVLVNLCINAMEAMPERGTLSLAFTVQTGAENLPSGLPFSSGSYVELEVADTGFGMSEEIRQRIFEPFFTTKDTAGFSGTGLGLSTAYGIIQAHGGAITVASTRGKGSTFRVYLPVGSLPPLAATVPLSSAQGHGRVLLVEDEVLLRELGATILETLGYQVVVAADGLAAVELYRAHHQELDAVLLDLKMPQMAGREAFLELRKIDPGVPVIVCTGFGENEEVQELLSLGAAGMLAKPYQISALAAKLRQVIAVE